MAGKILDAYGRPYETKALDKELAAPTPSGLRTAWYDAVSGGLTPRKLAGILTAAAEGDATDYLTLAMEMEEKEPHYASVLGTRKLALEGLQRQVIAASDDKRDKEIADACADMLIFCNIADHYADLADGIAKGYAVLEMIWTGVKHWTPRLEWRDQRHFMFDKISGQQLRLRDENKAEGQELPAAKFIVHKPKLRTGLPIRGGLARLAAWAFIFKTYTLKDWMAFAEVFGTPLRIGRYGPQATKDDINILLRAMMGLGTDGIAAIPESMRIEFQQAGNIGSATDLFERLAVFMDKQVSKAVLGQTMTADEGSSRSQSETHDTVRHDILRADARQLAGTITRDLVRPYVDLNFGVQERYPRVEIPVPDPEDQEKWMRIVERFVRLGGKVAASTVADRLNIPAPADGDELLTPPATGGMQPGMGMNRAMNTVLQDVRLSDQVQAVAQEIVDDGWREVVEPVLNPAQEALRNCQSYEEALACLTPELLERMDETALREALTMVCFQARALGNQYD